MGGDDFWQWYYYTSFITVQMNIVIVMDCTPPAPPLPPVSKCSQVAQCSMCLDHMSHFSDVRMRCEVQGRRRPGQEEVGQGTGHALAEGPEDEEDSDVAGDSDQGSSRVHNGGYGLGHAIRTALE